MANRQNRLKKEVEKNYKDKSVPIKLEKKKLQN